MRWLLAPFGWLAIFVVNVCWYAYGSYVWVRLRLSGKKK